MVSKECSVQRFFCICGTPSPKWRWYSDAAPCALDAGDSAWSGLIEKAVGTLFPFSFFWEGAIKRIGDGSGGVRAIWAACLAREGREA